VLPADQGAMLGRIERRARYQWAAGLAGRRDVLDLGCGEGEGAALLHAAGASNVVAVERSAEAIDRARSALGAVIDFAVGEPLALTLETDRFDLVTCFGPLETTSEPETLLDEIRRVLRPDGALVASLQPTFARTGSGGERASELRPMIEDRFAEVHPIAQDGSVTSVIGSPEADYTMKGRLSGVASAVVAGPGALTIPGPLTTTDEPADLEKLLEAASDWEERARGAEAEVSAMRWEALIAGEKLTALVNHLAFLENRPGRMLGRLLRGKPARVLKQEIADPPRPWRRH